MFELKSIKVKVLLRQTATLSIHCHLYGTHIINKCIQSFDVS